MALCNRNCDASNNQGNSHGKNFVEPDTSRVTGIALFRKDNRDDDDEQHVSKDSWGNAKAAYASLDQTRKDLYEKRASELRRQGTSKRKLRAHELDAIRKGGVDSENAKNDADDNQSLQVQRRMSMEKAIRPANEISEALGIKVMSAGLLFTSQKVWKNIDDVFTEVSNPGDIHAEYAVTAKCLQDGHLTHRHNGSSQRDIDRHFTAASKQIAVAEDGFAFPEQVYYREGCGALCRWSHTVDEIRLHNEILSSFDAMVGVYGKPALAVQADILLHVHIFDTHGGSHHVYAFLTAPALASGPYKSHQVFILLQPCNGDRDQPCKPGLLLQLVRHRYVQVHRELPDPISRNKTGMLVKFMSDTFAKCLVHGGNEGDQMPDICGTAVIMQLEMLKYVDINLHTVEVREPCWSRRLTMKQECSTISAVNESQKKGSAKCKAKKPTPSSSGLSFLNFGEDLPGMKEKLPRTSTSTTSCPISSAVMSGQKLQIETKVIDDNEHRKMRGTFKSRPLGPMSDEVDDGEAEAIGGLVNLGIKPTNVVIDVDSDTDDDSDGPIAPESKNAGTAGVQPDDRDGPIAPESKNAGTAGVQPEAVSVTTAGITSSVKASSDGIELGYFMDMGHSVTTHYNIKVQCLMHRHCSSWVRAVKSGYNLKDVQSSLTQWLACSRSVDVDQHAEMSYTMKTKFGMKPKPFKLGQD
eukprot:TRINITY_DN13585_c0_g1_i1.p1 TRINITY_DN13585_c0_g1~~TRINITY_DN13585_c0_g1_i1.p1  ORF type:complete len:759 (+),score=119.14 TRINITY_DN13585_c0_g1_i1:195-2279(+)